MQKTIQKTMQKTNVIIKADSINVATGNRATTILLTRFPYTLIQEPATHRLISQGTAQYFTEALDNINPFGPFIARSSASTRAIPVEKLIQKVLDDPFIPTWSKHQKGMSGIEDNDLEFQERMDLVHRRHLNTAIAEAREMVALGAHKQHINDLLKPWLRIPILATATEKGWNNFFQLRTDKPCRPEFREYAIWIKEAYDNSKPKELRPGEWHIPFSEHMHEDIVDDIEMIKIASARCARLSYASHDGEISKERDLSLAESLINDGHMGPFEHSLLAVEPIETLDLDNLDLKVGRIKDKQGKFKTVYTRNFDGFYSYRAVLEDNIQLV